MQLCNGGAVLRSKHVAAATPAPPDFTCNDPYNYTQTQEGNQRQAHPQPHAQRPLPTTTVCTRVTRRSARTAWPCCARCSSRCASWQWGSSPSCPASVSASTCSWASPRSSSRCAWGLGPAARLQRRGGLRVVDVQLWQGEGSLGPGPMFPASCLGYHKSTCSSTAQSFGGRDAAVRMPDSGLQTQGSCFQWQRSC